MPKVVHIDLEQLEKLGRFQCTYDELAAWFHCDRRTIIRRMKQQDAKDAFERGKAQGRISLRQAQFSAALAGNSTMLIWMGKQLLDQKDTVITEHSGEMTVNDGARERLLSKLSSLTTPSAITEGDSVVN
jgi:hypothetical protein